MVTNRRRIYDTGGWIFKSHTGCLEPGYGGLLCSVCQEQYSQKVGLICEECTEWTWMGYVAVFIIVLILILVAKYVKKWYNVSSHP